MKDELFQQLAASLKEGGAILRGKKKAARSTTLNLPDLSGKVPPPGKGMPTKHAKLAKC
jgi:hypothetical protein